MCGTEQNKRYLDHYNLKTKSHEKRPLQGGPNSLAIVNNQNFMAITSEGKMQVFDMQKRQTVSSFEITSSDLGKINHVKYWKYLSPSMISFSTSDNTVFTWDISSPNLAPKPIFKLNDALSSGKVVEIETSNDLMWFAIVIREEISKKQNVQLFSVSRNVSSVLDSSAVSICEHKNKSCNIMALTKITANGIKLIVAELNSQPGPGKFERLVLDVPTENRINYPVSIMFSESDNDILIVVNSSGMINVAHLSQRKWIIQSSIPVDDIFISSSGEDEYISCSSKGKVFGFSIKTNKSPVDVFSSLSLSPVENPIYQSEIDKFFSQYPSELFNLYKNNRNRFLPYIQENKIDFDWKELINVDKDISVASKLSFGIALSNFNLASRKTIVDFFISKGWLSDTNTFSVYTLEILANTNNQFDSDLQTEALISNLKTNPKIVFEILSKKTLTYFDSLALSLAAEKLNLWDIVWLIQSSDESHFKILSNNASSINPNVILAWFNNLPVDFCIRVLELLSRLPQGIQILSWDRIAAPPNNKLAPHIDLTISPPFQTLRVKVEIAKDLLIWKRYIDLLIIYGESKELTRTLIAHSYDNEVNTIVENAVKEAAKQKSLAAAMPLLLLAEKSNKIEDFVSYYLNRPDSSSFLISYATVIQPQNASRVIVLAMINEKTELVKGLILESIKTKSITESSLWLAANQSNTTKILAPIINSLSKEFRLPLLDSLNQKFSTQ